MVKELNMLSKVSNEMIESFMSKHRVSQVHPVTISLEFIKEMEKSQPELLNVLLYTFHKMPMEDTDKEKSLWVCLMTWKLLSQAAEVEELENQL